MRLNPLKCNEMFIDFLHYPPPLQLSGSEIERVHTYKLLGVYITDNLCWSTHCEYIRAQTPVCTTLFEEFRCDGMGFSSCVLQPDPFSVGVCLPSLGKFDGIP